MAQQRYESVDCAKALGIMLVVFAHVIATHNVGWKVEEVITSFHMPLFFVLSGMFFSRKKTIGEFIIGKINRLVVPFFFFFITISVLLPFAYYCYKGIGLSRLPSLLLGFYNENLIVVGAIWFLLSLFFVDIIVWLITIPARFKERWAIFVSILLGVIGYLLGKYSINIPCWLDTSLTCMPYFYLGYLLKNNTKLLSAQKADRYNILLAVACLLIVILLSGHTCYRANHYNIPIWSVFICGILGFFAVFFLSNTKIKRIGWLLFVGKNSIIILAIHQLIMMGGGSSFKVCSFFGMGSCFSELHDYNGHLLSIDSINAEVFATRYRTETIVLELWVQKPDFRISNSYA